MNRRVLGGGAIVCSAVVLWAQPSAPEAGTDDCVNGVNGSASSCPSAAAGQKQGYARIITPLIDSAQGLLNLQWSSRANQLPAEMEAVYDSLLRQAQTAANDDRLAAALSTVTGIPKNSQHYERARELQENWSQELVQRATNRCQQGDIAAAIAMLEAVPPSSQRYARATDLRESWSEQAVLLQQARSARAASDWSTVVAALEALKGTPLYSSLPVQQLLQQAISRNFQPNAAMMQLASNRLAPQVGAAPAASAPPTPAAPARLDAIASTPTLEIDLAQAMEWAQPPDMTVASAPTAGTVNISSPRSAAEQSLRAASEAASVFGKDLPPIVLKYFPVDELGIEPDASAPAAASPSAAEPAPPLAE